MLMENNSTQKHQIDPHKPKVKLPSGKSYLHVKEIVEEHGLSTICQSGKCPNLAECWGNGTATFMILGDICTRSCRFCSVKTGKPLPVDADEPQKIADSVKKMNLKHCVITSVDRDDLSDGGASDWRKTILAIKEKNPTTKIEVLIPDFKFDTKSLDLIISANPDIISHNLETVERLTPKVRVQAKYSRSLKVLEYLSSKNVITKSGIMLGLSETKEEILTTMDDLLKINCKIITIGQYLQPTPSNLPVTKFYSPEEFAELKQRAVEKGFRMVESGNLVRSSYHAEKHV
jgi:lipoyl synthase